MNSSLIGKIEKAKRYATEERHRIHFEALRVRFEGANAEHEVILQDNRWRCTCDFFAGWGLCCHTMALERVLDAMLPEQVRSSEVIARQGAAGVA